MLNFQWLTLGLAISSGRFTSSPPKLVSWLIDGNNLQCSSRLVPDQREALIEELKRIASPGNEDIDSSFPIANVVLVFDGSQDEAFKKTVVSSWFQYVVTDGEGRQKDRADDYIINHALPDLNRLGGQVLLVSADKELAKRASRFLNGSVVHPPKFWQQYLPILQQKQQLQEQKN